MCKYLKKLFDSIRKYATFSNDYKKYYGNTIFYNHYLGLF